MSADAPAALSADAPAALSAAVPATTAAPAAPAAPQRRPAPSVARSTALMAVATLGSRVTGLIRTWVMAFALGATMVTSAYQVANNTPNIIYELVAGGLLSAAFVPLYLLQAEKLGKPGGDRYASNLLNIVIIVMGLLSLGAVVFAEEIIWTQSFTLGDGAAVRLYAVYFFRIFAIQILFYGLGGVFTSILNANRVYFLPSIAPLFNNIVVIASFASYPLINAFDPEAALLALAVGTTLGVFVQFAVQIPALVRLGFKYSPRIRFKDPAFIDTLKTGVPMIIYVVGTLVSFSFRNSFSLESGDDGPATLFYAWIWFQLPHGIVAASLSRALFTEMSEARARDDMTAFTRFMRQGISGTLFVVIPLAALMSALSTPLMQVFQAGAFTARDGSYAAGILSLWVFALPCYSLQLYLFNVFASIRRFGLFSGICTALCVLQCSLYALLCSNESIALAGVPIADFAYYAISTAILLVCLRAIHGPLGGRPIATSALRVLLASIVGALLAAVASSSLPLGSGAVGGALTVAAYGIPCLLAIIVLCWLMRVPEMSIVGQVGGRLFRRVRNRT